MKRAKCMSHNPYMQKTGRILSTGPFLCLLTSSQNGSVAGKLFPTGQSELAQQIFYRQLLLLLSGYVQYDPAFMKHNEPVTILNGVPHIMCDH